MPKAREWSEEEKQWMKDNISYDTETGNLFWATPRLRGPKTTWFLGYINMNGYMCFNRSFGGRGFYYRNHRVVWFLNYGYVPDFLDHIDGDKLNNRVENLRPATNSLNQRNKLSYGRCKFKGVCASKNKYRARLKRDNKEIRTGYFETPEEAARAYDKFVEEELTPLERQFAKTNEEMGLYDNDT
tara:strand:- start:105 stop:659 length:555 start_codon:yes stop_codon:yes gene_type:complete